MKALALAAAAQVVVGAADTLVAEPDNRALATVAGDADVLLSVAVSG